VIAVAKKDTPLTRVDRAVIRVLFGPKAGRVSGTQQVDDELNELIDDQSKKDKGNPK
jgi:hypothetical protein